jgi:hypothetical protein
LARFATGRAVSTTLGVFVEPIEDKLVFELMLLRDCGRSSIIIIKKSRSANKSGPTPKFKTRR